MDFSKLKAALDEIVKDYNTPGVDVIVCREHKRLFRYFTGVSDIEKNRPVDGNELYTIFSMTKMLTCTCALQLFEKGKYSLDDHLAKFMPEFAKMKVAGSGNYAEKPITIYDLFTMSAGLDYELWTDGVKEAVAQGKGTRDIVAAFAEKELCFEPGTRFKYSLCHDVLGALIEIWSDMSLGEYMKKYLFEPLGMKNTFFGIPKDSERLSRMVPRYEFDKSGNPVKLPLEIMYNLSKNYESGGAGLVSCTEDYSVFLDALANFGVAENGNKILNKSTVELMGTNQLSGKRLEDFYTLRMGYGYGLGVRTHIDPGVSGSKSPLGEFGWDGAAGAFSLVDLKNNLSLTYFQQVHNWKIEIQNKIRNALYSSI